MSPGFSTSDTSFSVMMEFTLPTEQLKSLQQLARKLSYEKKADIKINHLISQALGDSLSEILKKKYEV